MLMSLFSDRARLDGVRAILEKVAPLVEVGCAVQLWDGTLVPLWKKNAPDPAAGEVPRITISGPGVISSLMRWPTLDKLLQHYAAGRIGFEGGTMVDFCELLRSRRKKVRLKQLGAGWIARKLLPFALHPGDYSHVAHSADKDGRRTAHSDNQALISFHYDVGNEFYQLFLDPEMQYSCAYFTDWSNSLEQAQCDKLDMICRKLRLQPGDRMLDVGCGWGGLICHAARHYGVQAVGITLSEEQLKFTQAKVRRLGLERQIRVELRDYISMDGTFDKISSIGMYEHVGIANYAAYFGKLCSLLRDNGILLNHGITRSAKASARRFRKGRPEQRLIQKYIFPGGELDHIGHTLESLESCRFMVHDVEGWREHYALTTRLWCERLSARAEEAIRLVGPEKFRLWVAYLAGVSFAFTDGSARIFQVVATKHVTKGSSHLPPTRADLYHSQPQQSAKVA